MNRSLRLSIAGVCVLAAFLALGSCSKKQTKTEAPVYYPDSILAKVEEIVNQGYELLDTKDLAGATAKFAEVAKLVPNGMCREYHTACAHARMGDAAEAFRWLTRAVDNGMDLPQVIEVDPDFNELRDDPRMKAIIERTHANYEKGTAHFASGLPEFTGPADTFTSVASLDAWKNNQEALIYNQFEFWTISQFFSERAAAEARYLAALRVLKAGDPAFDYGLERIRASMRIQSRGSLGWGSVSELVLHEVDSYLKVAASAAGADEARYLASVALSLKHENDDARCAESFTRAETYLSKIADGSEFFAGAQALMLAHSYALPGADKSGFAPALRTLVERFPSEERIRWAFAMHHGGGLAAAYWPIEIGAADLDGTIVSLAEYRGKALLIDFWATWCAPCRAELPHLVKAYAEYHPRGFEIVSISFDRPERLTKEAYRDSVASLGMTWRHIYDGKGGDSDVAKRFFVGGIPAPFLVGRDGSLVAWGKDLRGEKLAASIEKALGAGL